MRRLSSLGLLLAFTALGSSLGLAQGMPAPARPLAPAAVAPPTPSTDDSATYTFAFQDADVAQVASEIFGALGVAYSVDPSVTARISFRIDQRLTRLQLLQAFESALAANGVALVRNGESMVVTKADRARASAEVRAAGAGVSRAGYEVLATPLSYISASEAQKAIEAIRGEGVVLYASDALGLIVLGGSSADLTSVLDTLKLLDQNGLQNTRVRYFELNQASATGVAQDVNEMLKAGHIVGITAAPLRRLNGIMLFGRTPQALDEVGQWILRLDAPGREAATGLHVYHPRNASAESLATTLNAVMSSQSAFEARTAGGASNSVAVPAPQSSQIISDVGGGTTSQADDAVRVAVDKGTNTLLVSAPSWKWVQLQRALAEIDRPQSQILIEVSILEVTLNDEFRMGVDWSLLDRGERLGGGFINNAQGVVQPTYPGFNLTYLNTGISAAINALGKKTAVQVISSPKIVALDNHKASLQVGDEVPVVTQASQSTSAAGAPLVNSVDYRNSGVILSVTPRISGDNKIALEVAQEVSSVAKTDTSGIDSPTIQQRKLESTLTLADGGVVALGGLISSSRNSGDSGIPGLMRVPGLGHLFKSSDVSNTRTELIVLLSAKIVTDPSAADHALQDLLADMREIRGRGLVDAAR